MSSPRNDPEAGAWILEKAASTFDIPAACRCNWNWKPSPDWTWIRLVARTSCPLHGRATTPPGRAGLRMGSGDE